MGDSFRRNAQEGFILIKKHCHIFRTCVREKSKIAIRCLETNSDSFYQLAEAEAQNFTDCNKEKFISIDSDNLFSAGHLLLFRTCKFGIIGANLSF